MALADQIIGVESGGNPNAHLCAPSVHVSKEFWTNVGVLKLLFASSPAAIRRFVIAIAVDAINGVLRAGARPHILVEISKGSPSLTNSYPALSVERPRNMARLRAAANHSIPDLILRCRPSSSRHGLRHAVGPVNLKSPVGAKASAAICITGAEVGHGHNDLGAAVAPAQISAYSCAAIFSDFWDRFSQGQESSKSRVNVVNGWAH